MVLTKGLSWLSQHMVGNYDSFLFKACLFERCLIMARFIGIKFWDQGVDVF
ncbi:hypothetical protein JCM21142_41654 [Saccharicrinis fermentans DSM 9555 = JCM 21142]|uniref:Uncharacterized protein n=1 Tax=Saccharicrinis fermentans DSM 9555 = JCM 21142 TaxID=869213 RepID=W7YEZ3_9BACT|nr:hypothetical protein JCM21142_41654 [Saccharicrinis fermentans DSM 9555 = JCM 21142]